MTTSPITTTATDADPGITGHAHTRTSHTTISMATGLDTALDELYDSGWAAHDSTDCENHTDGRMYPSLIRVQREFMARGYELIVRHINLFDCYRAEWTDAKSNPVGAVVGSTEIEAALYALSRLRKALKADVNP